MDAVKDTTGVTFIHTGEAHLWIAAVFSALTSSVTKSQRKELLTVINILTVKTRYNMTCQSPADKTNRGLTPFFAL